MHLLSLSSDWRLLFDRVQRGIPKTRAHKVIPSSGESYSMWSLQLPVNVSKELNLWVIPSGNRANFDWRFNWKMRNVFILNCYKSVNLGLTARLVIIVLMSLWCTSFSGGAHLKLYSPLPLQYILQTLSAVSSVCSHTSKVSCHQWFDLWRIPMLKYKCIMTVHEVLAPKNLNF